MNNPVAAEESLYFEMGTKEATDAGIYDDVVAPGAKQLTSEKQGAENSRRASTEPAHSSRTSDAAIVQRLLCMMTAVIIFCVLIAATTLVLALTMMSRNTSATDCTVVQESDTKTPNTAYAELSKNVQDLKANISSLKVTSSEKDEKYEKVQKELEDIKKKYEELKAEMVNVTKTHGPRGPPGYNGTQGPPGVTGPPGSPGHNGTQSGGLSLCSFKDKRSPGVSPLKQSKQK